MGIERIVGTLIGGTQVGNALGGIADAEDAEDKQFEAGQKANETQRYFYDTTRKDNLPFLQTGYQANDLLKALMSSGAITADPTFSQYQSDPSYNWQQSEALKAVQGSAAAKGSLYSGATQRAIADRAQNIANADFGNWWNRRQQGASNKVNMLNAIRSGGQVASGAIGSAGQNAANNISATQIGQGNAAAASLLAQGQIAGNALNRASSYFPGMNGGFFGG